MRFQRVGCYEVIAKIGEGVVDWLMSLHPGTVLGPYEVVAEIGKGGMGEVYRARDADNSRQVSHWFDQ